MKAYTTRVGLGPFPTELEDETGDLLREKGWEYGSTTGRPRRCGWFDAVAMRYSAMINGIDAVSITKLDVLSGMDEIRICTGYALEGKRLKSFPTNIRELNSVTPLYESMPGWRENITDITAPGDMPDSVHRYLRRVQELIEVPLTCVSVGPRRDQTIVLQDTHAW